MAAIDAETREPETDHAPAFTPPRWLIITCLSLIVIGLAGLGIGAGLAPTEAWLWLIVNFVFFGGIARGMLVWAATFRIAQARWTPAINRLGHSAIAAGPFMYAALIVLLAGVRGYVPWIEHPIPLKAGWLNVPFMVLRDSVLLLLLYVLFLLLVRWTLEADARARRGKEIGPSEQYRLTAISVAAVMVYVVTDSVLTLDFIMSLSPEWYSTMFPPYIWVTNMYLSMTVIVILAAALGKAIGAGRYLGKQQFKDMGNLMLGFSLLSMGLFFAQYLTIWYENLYPETFFLIIRYDKGPWPWLGWIAFFVGYALPFVLLQSRYIKEHSGWLSGIAVLTVLGIALERYVLVVPSIAPDNLAIFPIASASLVAFLGAFVLSVVWFLSRYSPVSSAAVALRKADAEVDRRLEAVE